MFGLKPKPRRTGPLGKPKCILDENLVFLNLFASPNVYFSSCLVFFLRLSRRVCLPKTLTSNFHENLEEVLEELRILDCVYLFRLFWLSSLNVFSCSWMGSLVRVKRLNGCKRLNLQHRKKYRSHSVVQTAVWSASFHTFIRWLCCVSSLNEPFSSCQPAFHHRSGFCIKCQKYLQMFKRWAQQSYTQRIF